MIPLQADSDRFTPGGRVRVYETRNGGETWNERGHGLPGLDAYLAVLRQAFDQAGAGESLELYFGATSGDVFGSADAGGELGERGGAVAPGLFGDRQREALKLKTGQRPCGHG